MIDEFLVSAGGLTQSFWEGESEHEVGDGQEQLLLQLEPCLSLLMLAFWAMAVAAGMIAVTELAA